MENFGEFSLKLLIILGVVAVLGSPVACTMHENQLIANAIAKGSDPISVRCALESSGNSATLCMVKAATNNGSAIDPMDIRCVNPSSSDHDYCQVRAAMKK